MRAFLQRLAPLLQLTRVTSAFAAVANVWFVVLWTRAWPQEPGSERFAQESLWVLLPAAAAAAVGLFAFGTCVNDIIDLRRDRVLRPQRPLAAGRMSVETAAILVAGTIGLAVIGATAFGSGAVILTLVVAAAILLFNVAGKFVPALGVVIIGLIYAGHMLVPNVHLRFIWPVWLVMTHALIVSAVSHHLARKVPPISSRAALTAVLGWAFWSAVLIGSTLTGPEDVRGLWPSWVSPFAAIGPLLLVVGFAIFAAHRVLIARSGQQAAEKISRYGSVWLVLYAVAWMLGAGRVREAAILSLLAVGALAGVTVLRETYGLLERPLAYRR